MAIRLFKNVLTILMILFNFLSRLSCVIKPAINYRICRHRLRFLA